MYIVLVEHQNAGKRYVFDCTALSNIVRLGDTVICETIRGKQTGKAVTNPIRVESNDGSLASLFKLCGAYFPIKRIVGIERQKELTAAEKERIAKEWLRERLGWKSDPLDQTNELPF